MTSTSLTDPDQPAPEDPLPLAIGTVIADKYTVESVLGVGGMGAVVAARHRQLDELVAIKVMTHSMSKVAEAVPRFLREARASIKIRNPHVVRVMDVGTLDTGEPYMVMEHLEGMDLATRIASSGRLPINEAVQYLLEASEAIAEAHALGIVHRDLKPANLFLANTAEGGVWIKVLDFGISKMAQSADQAAMTSTSAVMGSPLYMPPEQMSSTRSVDRRADIWSLGAVLFEALAGRPPFQAETMPQLCAMILQEAPASLRALRPEVPESLEQVVLKCLATDRNRRFSDVGELALALHPFGTKSAKVSVERIVNTIQRSGQSTSGIQLPPASVIPPATVTPANPVTPANSAATASATAASWGSTNPAPRHSKLAVIGVGAALVLTAAVGVLLLVNRGDATDSGEGSAPVTSLPSATAAAPASQSAPPVVVVEEPEPEPSTSVPVASASSAPPAGSVKAFVPAKTKPPTLPPKPPVKPKSGLDEFDERK